LTGGKIEGAQQRAQSACQQAMAALEHWWERINFDGICQYN